MFAHNNKEIDYFKMAVLNAYLIQKHLGLDKGQITIVTDYASLDYGKNSLGEDFVHGACDSFVFVEIDTEFKYKNSRIFKDTYYSPKSLPFYNVNRADAYDLSPYEETIVIDVDYLIFSDALNNCWGSNNDLMMNWEFNDIMSERKFQGLDRLNPLGITMYWATVVYFKKTPESETFFNLVKYVRDNRDYFSDVYKFDNRLYRNDFSFSIAAHMMYGFKDKGLPQLPVKLYKTFDTDDIYFAKKRSLYFYLEKPDATGDFMITKWKDQDVHIMNKWAINRTSEYLFNYALDKLPEEVDPDYAALGLPNPNDIDVTEEPEPVKEEPKVEFTDVNDALAAFKAMQEKKKAKQS